MSSMNIDDAVVAIRSLPRRFGEALNGPGGDPAWERRIRSVGHDGRSALGFAVYTTDVLTVLGTAIASLPVKTNPPADLSRLSSTYSEPKSDRPASDVLMALKEAAQRAGDAVASRSHEQLDRTCSVDGAIVEAREVVRRVVALGVTSLRSAVDLVESGDDSSGAD